MLLSLLMSQVSGICLASSGVCSAAIARKLLQQKNSWKSSLGVLYVFHAYAEENTFEAGNHHNMSHTRTAVSMQAAPCYSLHQSSSPGHIAACPEQSHWKEVVTLCWHHSREDTVQSGSPMHCSRKQASWEVKHIPSGISALGGCARTCQPARDLGERGAAHRAHIGNRKERSVAVQGAHRQI